MPIIRVDNIRDMGIDKRADNLAEISYLLRQAFAPPQVYYNVNTLKNGLVAYWPFKNDSRGFSNWVHPFAISHNLTGQSSDLPYVAFPQGKVGWGMQTNGRQVYADDFNIPGNGWSVSFWYAPNDIVFGTNDTNTSIISLYDNNTAHEVSLADASIYYELDVFGNGSIFETLGPEWRLRFNNAPGSPTINLGDGGWKHHAIVQSTGSLVWYINNSPAASGNGSPFLLELSKITLSPTVGSVIDELGVWNRPLNALEISGLYADPVARQYPFIGATDSYS